MGRFTYILMLAALLTCTMRAQAQQQPVVLSGKLLNTDFQPVVGCAVYIKGTQAKATTNKHGIFCFAQRFTKGQKVKISITDIGYAVFEKEYVLQTTTDTFNISITLEPNELVEVPIFSGPQVVYQSKTINVWDFEFVDDKLLMLTYEKRPGNNMRLVLATENSEPISSYLVNRDALKLERDYQGKIHLVTENGVFEVNVRNEKIYVLQENKNDYEKYLKPLVAENEDKLYFSNYAWHYPAFSYYAYGHTDSSYKTLKYIEDKFMLDMYRAEYKYVDTRTKLEAYRMQLRTGVDKEIWAAVWNGFPNSLYYKPIYAPMFVRHDTVMIFDHYANHVYYFDEYNRQLDSFAINYHLGKEASYWKKQLMMDDVSKKIYSLFEKNGTYTLAELSKEGKPVHFTPLKNKYPEKIKVHNGYAYFNYRPFESTQNKYLYKQPLQ